MNAITGSGSSDEELIQQHTEGNTKALSVLYSRYYDKVYHRCLSFTRITSYNVCYTKLLRVSPKSALNFVIALFLGFMLPTVYILVIDFFNNRLCDVEEIEQLAGKPVLGKVFRNFRP